MNEADSEKLKATFESQGMSAAKLPQKADLVVVNTCSVRQTAEDRVTGFIYNLKNNSQFINHKSQIIITGCMLRYSKAKLKKLLPLADDFQPLDQLINPQVSPKRTDKSHAWVPIMQGCDNFCTYCVVPYGRGQERSRPIQEVYQEVKCLVDQNYKKITLLGQNVNSYHKKSRFKIKNQKIKNKVSKLEKKYQTKFAILLNLLHSIKELEKISFITSNPHDMDDDIIKAISLPKIDRLLHLPVQSGDNQILKKMNRKYTREHYLNLISKIKSLVPKIRLGTDIIVGFPGETKKQFQNTVDLCQQVDFEIAYINKYSPRPGTAAYSLGDPIPWSEKKRRWHILNNLINN